MKRIKTRKQKCEEQTTEWILQAIKWRLSREKTREWLRKGNLKRVTESLITAAQNKTIRTNYIKGKIDNTQQNSKCSLCEE